MNENVKMFIKKVNEDESLKKEFSEISDKLKVETDRENAITTHILPFAKKAGYDFTMADFEIDGQLSEEELKAVSGGSGGCACVRQGSGEGTDCYDEKTYDCTCVICGQGGDGRSNDFNCICIAAGGGYN